MDSYAKNQNSLVLRKLGVDGRTEPVIANDSQEFGKQVTVMG